MAIENSQILKAASALGVLGGGPHSAYHLLGMLSNPELEFSDVCSLIEQDPGLTARVLRVANSAFYGVPRDVTTIHRAITLLGVDAVRGIAAAACLDRALPSTGDHGAVDAATLVKHSLAAALAAEALAHTRHPKLVPEVFIAALLHDLGVSVQARLDKDGTQRLAQALRETPNADLRELESRCVSVSHEQCAGVVFQHWQLPAPLTEAARHHHQPLSAPQTQRMLAVLAYLGVQASLMAGYVHALEPQPDTIDPAVLSTAGVTLADLEAVAKELPSRMELFTA